MQGYLQNYLLFMDVEITKQQFSYFYTTYPNAAIPSGVITLITDLTPEDLFDDIRGFYNNDFYKNPEYKEPSKCFSSKMVEWNLSDYIEFNVQINDRKSIELLCEIYNDKEYLQYLLKKQLSHKKLQIIRDISQTCQL